MKKSFLNKIILVVVLTLSVAATWLYANPVDVATDSGFDTSYDGGSGGYSGGRHRHGPRPAGGTDRHTGCQ